VDPKAIDRLLLSELPNYRSQTRVVQFCQLLPKANFSSNGVITCLL